MQDPFEAGDEHDHETNMILNRYRREARERANQRLALVSVAVVTFALFSTAMCAISLLAGFWK